MDIKDKSGKVLLTVEGPDLRETDLRGAYLRGADLRGADLYGVDLYGADLYGVDLSESYLIGVSFYGANLIGVNFYEANLHGANLRYANLCGVNLRKAYLDGADFSGAAGIIDFGDPYGYRVYTVQHEDGIRILAGCRWFTFTEAVKHWGGRLDRVLMKSLLRYIKITIKDKGWKL